MFLIFTNSFLLYFIQNLLFYRLGGTKKTTIIRKVSGDTNTFISEMGTALGVHEKDMKEAVRIRAGGNIEVNGIHVKEIRTWLAGLGF